MQKTGGGKSKIIAAIDKARPGITRYLEIMERFSLTDVSQDEDFQRLFNGFYRIQRRQKDWYEKYYGYMESVKVHQPSFGDALRHLHTILERCEASFCSKLVATINPECPVWDKYVLANAGLTRPPYTSPNKVSLSIDCYGRLQKWYEEFLPSTEGKLMIDLFRENVTHHEKITDIKKVDFVLWQIR